MVRHPLYSTWEGMRQRCRNPNHAAYPWYGALGISICARWDDFRAFAADVGEKPTPEHTLDRINGAKRYEPDNVRWADKRTQSLNKRLRCDNTSGRHGITWFARTSSWAVSVAPSVRRYVHIGYFTDLADAIASQEGAVDAIKSGLFDAAYAQLLASRKLHHPFRNNTSGTRGVCFNERRSQWEAFGYLQNKKQHLGWFSTSCAAAAARTRFMEQKHGSSDHRASR